MFRIQLSLYEPRMFLCPGLSEWRVRMVCVCDKGLYELLHPKIGITCTFLYVLGVGADTGVRNVMGTLKITGV